MTTFMMTVPIAQLSVSGDNMREDVGDLVELADSITRYGILQPLVVEAEAGGFAVVCGHRRLAAARRAGLKEIPVVVRELSDDERLALMIVENVHRKHLSPLEEAHAFEKLGERGMSQREVAETIDKSQSYVAYRIKLLSLPEDIQQQVHRGEISLQKAIGYDKRGLREGRPPDKRDPDQKWQVFYIDKLVKWLEAGRIDLDDDRIFKRLRLLGEAVDAFRSRLTPAGDIIAGIKMCHDCGSVVGIERCCDEHPDLVCASCGEQRHPDEVAS